MQAFRRLLDAKGCASFRRIFAGIAQLVEQLICNQQVVGSNPTAGSLVKRDWPIVPKSWLGHFLATYQQHPYVSCTARSLPTALVPSCPTSRCLCVLRTTVEGNACPLATGTSETGRPRLGQRFEPISWVIALSGLVRLSVKKRLRIASNLVNVRRGGGVCVFDACDLH